MIIENNALAPKIADHISLSSWLIPCTDETARAQKKEAKKLRTGKYLLRYVSQPNMCRCGYGRQHCPLLGCSNKF